MIGFDSWFTSLVLGLRMMRALSPRSPKEAREKRVLFPTAGSEARSLSRALHQPTGSAVNCQAVRRGNKPWHFHRFHITRQERAYSRTTISGLVTLPCSVA